MLRLVVRQFSLDRSLAACVSTGKPQHAYVPAVLDPQYQKAGGFVVNRVTGESAEQIQGAEPGALRRQKYATAFESATR